MAQARMAQIRSSGTWGSALTSDEFAAVRSVGFDPVGQVFGAAVYSVGHASYSCPGTWRTPPAGKPATQVSGQRAQGSFGPLVQAMGQARDTAMERLTSECRQLGGHGVVGVRLSIGSFPAGGPEFLVIGTAVRARGAAAGPRVPFTSGLSGQDFAKLIMTGWVPAGLVVGLSIGSRHDDWTTARQTRLTTGNAEVAGWTELVSESRRDARRELEGEVRRFGAEGVVMDSMPLRVRTRDCPAQVGRHDHVVEATFTGTAVTRFSPASPRQAGAALTVMSLNPRRDQVSRIRILGGPRCGEPGALCRVSGRRSGRRRRSSDRWLQSGLLLGHVRGVPVRPVRVGVADPLLVPARQASSDFLQVLPRTCPPAATAPPERNTTSAPAAPDAQDIHNALAAAGTTIVSAPVDGPFGRTFTFADPDGYQVTLHDRG
jgi:uncharacterized protein YbjQ (UPF0145 family)